MEGSLFCLKITIHLRQAHQPAFERVVMGVVFRGREWTRRCQSMSQATGAGSESPYSVDLSLLVPTLPCLITSCFLLPGRVFLQQPVLISGSYGKVIVTLLSSAFWRGVRSLISPVEGRESAISLPFFVVNVGKQQCTTQNLTLRASFVSDSSPFHWTQGFKYNTLNLTLFVGTA